MQRTLFAAAALAVVALCAAPTAGAAPLTVSSPVNVSIPSPFPPGCGGAAEGSVPGTNFNYENAEVEPWLAVSPTNPNDVAGMWQQDRWSNGGSHGPGGAGGQNGGGRPF